VQILKSILYAHSPDDGTVVPKYIQQILYLTEIYGEIVCLCLQNYCSSCLMTVYHMWQKISSSPIIYTYNQFSIRYALKKYSCFSQHGCNVQQPVYTINMTSFKSSQYVVLKTEYSYTSTLSVRIVFKDRFSEL